MGQCKECHKANQKRNYDKKVQAILDYKSSCSCAKCGETKGYMLEFHHKDPTEKDFNISDHSRASLESLMEEILKCVVLCSNHHKEFHWLNSKNGVTLDEYLNC